MTSDNSEGKTMTRVRVCDAAIAVLRETNSPAVMWGDCELLDMIHARAGLKQPRRPHPLNRHAQVLNALTRQPGELIPGYVSIGGRERCVRIFWLRGHEPERMRDIIMATSRPAKVR